MLEKRNLIISDFTSCIFHGNGIRTKRNAIGIFIFAHYTEVFLSTSSFLTFSKNDPQTHSQIAFLGLGRHEFNPVSGLSETREKEPIPSILSLWYQAQIQTAAGEWITAQSSKMWGEQGKCKKHSGFSNNCNPGPFLSSGHSTLSWAARVSDSFCQLSDLHNCSLANSSGSWVYTSV